MLIAINTYHIYDDNSLLQFSPTCHVTRVIISFCRSEPPDNELYLLHKTFSHGFTNYFQNLPTFPKSSYRIYCWASYVTLV